MNALGRTRAAFCIADHPAHGVAGSDGTGANKLFARFERDVGDFAGRSIDLIECTVREGIDLHRIDIGGVRRLDARGVVGRVDPHTRIGSFANS